MLNTYKYNGATTCFDGTVANHLWFIRRSTKDVFEFRGCDIHEVVKCPLPMQGILFPKWEEMDLELTLYDGITPILVSIPGQWQLGTLDWEHIVKEFGLEITDIHLIRKIFGSILVGTCDILDAAMRGKFTSRGFIEDNKSVYSLVENGVRKVWITEKPRKIRFRGITIKIEPYDFTDSVLARHYAEILKCVRWK